MEAGRWRQEDGGRKIMLASAGPRHSAGRRVADTSNLEVLHTDRSDARKANFHRRQINSSLSLMAMRLSRCGVSANRTPNM